MADMPDDHPPADPSSAAGWRSCPCPICQKMSDQKYHPFCSRRCADVDLARWLGGRYAVPAQVNDDEDGQWGGESEGDSAAEK